MKIASVAWVGHRAGTQCSLVPLSSISTVPYSRSEKFNDTFNFLLTSRLACVPTDHSGYCLCSSLVVLCLSFAGIAAVPARVPTCSVGEEMSADNSRPCQLRIDYLIEDE